MINFKAKLAPDECYYFNFYLFDSKTDLNLKMAEWYKGKCDYSAVCYRCNDYSAPEIGRILFYTDYFSIHLLCHELNHAIFHYFHFAQQNNKEEFNSIITNDKMQEKYCSIFEYCLAQILKRVTVNMEYPYKHKQVKVYNTSKNHYQFKKY